MLLLQLNIFNILLSTHLLICPSIHLCMCVGSLLGTNNRDHIKFPSLRCTWLNDLKIFFQLHFSPLSPTPTDMVDIQISTSYCPAILTFSSVPKHSFMILHLFICGFISWDISMFTI